MSKHQEILERYFPPAAINQVYQWIVKYKVHFRITKSRNTKLGDYQPLPKISAHKITINYDLNKWAFLIIFLHELAHLMVYETFKNKVAPHGKEWKETFRNLLTCFTGSNNIFPEDIALALEKFMLKPFASSGSDAALTRVLMKYNEQKTNEVLVEDIPEQGLFKTDNGEIFRKEKKIRTRFHCICMRNKRVYLFNPVAKVTPIN